LFKKYNKKKNGKACYVEWDLDASSDSDSDDDDEKPSKKGLVDIAIMEGIKNGFSAKHTPEQNGVIERKNRTLIDMARSMLLKYNVSDNFWA
jgi:hypothetical protein